MTWSVMFLGQPLWMWAFFFAIVVVLLVLDLGVLHRKSRAIPAGESLVLSAGYIALGLAFGGFVWWQLGSTAAVEYVTGFVVEKSLALDNIFVIAVIFGYFAVPQALQHRVLFWGILGVIVLRAIMIGVGATVVAAYGWVLYIFAVLLIGTGIKMLLTREAETDIGKSAILRLLRSRLNVTDRLHGERFFIRLPDASGRVRTFVTPLFLALVLIEIADVVFAVDSVPAIFAITTDPFLVYTSNIFAILGLRALYFALADLLHRFAYLKPALAVLLIFIGSKIFIADAFGMMKFPALWSLGISVSILAAGVGASLLDRSRAGTAEQKRG